GKGSLDNADSSPRPQMVDGILVDDRVFPEADLVDDVIRDRRGALAVADQPRDPDRRENGAPAGRFRIERHEEIARGKWPPAQVGPAGMAQPFPVARQIGRVALPLEIDHRPRLAVRMAMNAKPGHGAALFESDATGSTTGLIPSSGGINRRSAESPKEASRA